MWARWRRFADAGFVVLTAPYHSDRASAGGADRVSPRCFHEGASLAGDPKGLYRRARAGEIAISPAYRRPECRSGELTVDTGDRPVEQSTC